MTDDEADRLRADLAASDELRAGLAASAVDLSRDMVRALDFAQQLQTVVDAAVSWRQSFKPGVAPKANLEACQALRDRVDDYLKLAGSRS